MALRKLKIRAWSGKDNTATVKSIIFHPMETGQRKDKATGKLIPAHYITELKCDLNGKTILTCLWGPTVSKNPFISFRVKNAKAGDTVKLSWVDNRGMSGSGQAKIQ